MDARARRESPAHKGMGVTTRTGVTRTGAPRTRAGGTRRRGLGTWRRTSRCTWARAPPSASSTRSTSRGSRATSCGCSRCRARPASSATCSTSANTPRCEPELPLSDVAPALAGGPQNPAMSLVRTPQPRTPQGARQPRSVRAVAPGQVAGHRDRGGLGGGAAVCAEARKHGRVNTSVLVQAQYL
eukprot:1184493-Prorocentrum_minimum.AAC.1